MKKILISDDIFAGANFTSHLAYENDIWLNIKNTWYMITDILNFFISLANIAANFFLVFLILRFKRLRIRCNFYLINIAMMNTIYHTLAPMFFITMEVTRFHLKHRAKVFCFISDVEDGSCFTMHLFASVLALDWYLVNFCETFVRNHRKMYKRLIMFTFFAGALRYAAWTINTCINKKEDVYHLSEISYVLPLILLIIINILTLRKRFIIGLPEKKHSLVAANIVILLWIPLFIYEEVSMTHIGSYITRRIMSCTVIVPNILAHGNSIILLFVLGRISEDFRTAYGIAFRKNVDEYDLDHSENSLNSDSVEEQKFSVIDEESVNYDAAQMIMY